MVLNASQRRRISWYKRLKVGKKFGYLTVIELDSIKDDGHGSDSVKCKCICGSINYYRIISLLSERRPVRFCGKCPFSLSTALHAYITKRFSNYRRDAIYRNLAWNIDREFAISLMLAPCYYCGKRGDIRIFVREGIYKKWNMQDKHIVNGIDRLDNKLGYTNTNAVSCCSFCNYAKLNLSVEQFVANIKRLYEYLNLDSTFNIVNMAKTKRVATATY